MKKFKTEVTKCNEYKVRNCDGQIVRLLGEDFAVMVGVSNGFISASSVIGPPNIWLVDNEISVGEYNFDAIVRVVNGEIVNYEVVITDKDRNLVQHDNFDF